MGFSIIEGQLDKAQEAELLKRMSRSLDRLDENGFRALKAIGLSQGAYKALLDRYNPEHQKDVLASAFESNPVRFMGISLKPLECVSGLEVVLILDFDVKA